MVIHSCSVLFLGVVMLGRLIGCHYPLPWYYKQIERAIRMTTELTTESWQMPCFRIRSQIFSRVSFGTPPVHFLAHRHRFCEVNLRIPHCIRPGHCSGHSSSSINGRRGCGCSW